MDREIAPSPLSFDTSLVKFFCKTPETDKTDSGVKRVPKKQEKKPEKAERPKPSHSRFLFETDPSFEDISLDLIKNMGHEDSRVSKDKFDGNLNIEFFILNIFSRLCSDYEHERPWDLQRPEWAGREKGQQPSPNSLFNEFLDLLRDPPTQRK